MRIFVLKRKIGVWWRKPLVRAATALLIIIAAILIQYCLANWPTELEVLGPNKKFTPAIAKSKQEELVIERPVFDSSRVLFTLKTSSEFINSHFDKAQLFGRTLTYFQEKTPPAPAGQETIDFTTENVEQMLKNLGVAKGMPGRRNNEEKGTCLTTVTAEFPAGSEPPTQIHFYLPYDSDITRDVFMMVDAHLLVRLDTSLGVAQGRINPWTTGCGKHFKVGEWDRHLAISTEIEILAAPNSLVHFTFLPTPNSSWKNRNDLFQPFVFGSKPLQAQTVSVNPLFNDKPSANPLTPKFSASVNNGGKLLDLEHLVLNAEEIRLDFSGKALVKEHGEYVTESFYDRVRKYPLIAAFLGIVDLALLGLVGSIFKNIFFPRTQPNSV